MSCLAPVALDTDPFPFPYGADLTRLPGYARCGVDLLPLMSRRTSGRVPSAASWPRPGLGIVVNTEIDPKPHCCGELG